MAVGVKAPASLVSIELVINSVLDGTCTKEYVLERVNLETSGKSRAEKVNRTIRRVAVNNPLLPYIQEHKAEFKSDLKEKNSRAVVLTAILSGAYPIIYDTVSLLGKYLHAQDEVTSGLLRTKLSEKYGASTDFSIAFEGTLKMLVEAGIVYRPKIGLYSAKKMLKASDSALALYRKAFLQNNPSLSEDCNIDTNSFFEFIH